MKKIELVIVDDDLLLLELVKDFLASQNSLSILKTFNSGDDYISWAEDRDNKNYILLMDLKMQGKDGIEISESVKTNSPKVKIIIISSHYQTRYISFMLKLGISAFIPKGISKESLLSVISEVDRLGYYFLPEQVEEMRKQVSTNAPNPKDSIVNPLSQRETEVLKLICQQKTALEISEALFISRRTVEGHKNNLFVKTGTKNMAGLVIYAAQKGVISVDEMPLI